MASTSTTGINVGDAVLTFLGDTTQLDQAYARVNSGTATAVKPATDAIANMGVAIDQTGLAASIAQEQYTAAGRAALRMGEEGAAAGEEMAFSMHEAKGELALLGEETGITIPRHIRSFVAELPGVGKALNAAFEATAVLFIVQILAEATSKLTEFIVDTYIWTEANKEQYKSQVELNKAIDAQVQKLAGLKAMYDYVNLEGSAKTKKGLDDLLTSLAANEDALQDNKDTIFLYNNYLRGTAEEAEKAKNAIALLTAVTAAQEQEAINMKKLLDQQQLDESVKKGEAMAAAEKTTQAAITMLQYQEQRQRLIQGNAAYSELINAQTAYEERLYQIELKAMQERLKALQKDPTKNANAIVELHAQIEASENTHNANLLSKYNDFLTKLQAASKNLTTTLMDPWQLIDNDAGKILEDLKQDFATLGITGVLPLTEKLTAQKKAYDELAKSGKASKNDLIRANMVLLQTEIMLAHMQGESTAQMEKDLAKLTAQWNQIVGVVTRVRFAHISLFALWKKEVPTASETWHQLFDIAKFGFDDLAAAAENAAVSAILSQQSIGAALAQGTAQVLAQIAAQSAVYALFYLAKGFALLIDDPPGAADAFTSSAIYASVAGVTGAAAYGLNQAGGGGRSSGGGSTSTSGNSLESQPSTATAARTPAAPTPAVSVSVQHFASGALVTGRTLAVMGDAKGGGNAREAAIPLDDPQAVSEIATALGGGRNRGGHTFIIQGVISADNLNKVVKNINRNVGRGTTRLTSSNSNRLTKKA